MSTHLLEDMTQAQRLELFLHRLPAQITSFPIGTEISSSTLCQQLRQPGSAEKHTVGIMFLVHKKAQSNM